MVPRAVWSLGNWLSMQVGGPHQGSARPGGICSVVVGGRLLLNTLRPHGMVPTAECQSTTPEIPDLSEHLESFRFSCSVVSDSATP